MRRLVAALALLLLAGLPAPAGQPAPQPLPPFSVRDAAGREVTLDDFRGRVVLLDFWATWCAPCVAEMPALDRLQRRLGERGLSVVAVSIDRAGRPKVEAFYRRLGITALAIHLDEEREAVRALGIESIPASLLVDRAGRLVARFEGPHDWEADEDLLLRTLGSP